MGKFILGDFSRKALTGESVSGVHEKTRDWLGHAVVAPPFEAHTLIDFTGPPGSVSGVYYSLMFQLGKWEYLVQKADEWIEVSPVHAQYYQLTHKQKEDLEGRIKAGLQSVSQSVADLELILHDKRKYEEFLRYMGYRTPKETKDEHFDKDDKKRHEHLFGEDELCFEVDADDKPRKMREARADNHALKAVFVDQVDIHTGDGISMRSIVSRWPTLIIDFMKLKDDEMDVDKIADEKRLDISKAEAVVLITKNKLFVQWKQLFLANLKDRYTRILMISKAREKSVEEYRNWLKPIIARHRLIEEGLSDAGDQRKKIRTSFIMAGNHAVSSSNIEIWVWKDFASPEYFKGGSEDIARMTSGKDESKWKLSPYDAWTKKNFIFDKDQGLIADHPWITEAWVKEQLSDFYKTGWLMRHKLYYSFFIIGLNKTNMRMPTGDEIEDGMFDVNLIVMSQNAMFAKLLELRAKQVEFDDYTNNLLGIQTPKKGKRPGIDEKNRLENVKKFFEYFSLNFQFFKAGPYESDFEDRLTKYYFAPIAGDRYATIVGFIKSKIGMGK
jgi:hypothetical protein